MLSARIKILYPTPGITFPKPSLIYMYKIMKKGVILLFWLIITIFVYITSNKHFFTYQVMVERKFVSEVPSVLASMSIYDKDCKIIFSGTEKQ